MSKSPEWHRYTRTRNRNKAPQELLVKQPSFRMDVVSQATLRDLAKQGKQATGLSKYGMGPVIATLLKTHPLSQAIWKHYSSQMSQSQNQLTATEISLPSSSTSSSSGRPPASLS